ncbi:MAG TPA: class II fructose-bisphosphate aldolase [Microbacterium sp.]|uniref:class II fructose-bisphosphate aldolase n=1 Tax=Microbacterium sp. TaxID=51671 RepID=UPI002B47CBFD|nr:class II fructose-bisphosphate aldolase [Microbacterium sp.]HKT57450.1 class II fructose-bisphosphate aldolase [Microbacterium sp.]
MPLVPMSEALAGRRAVCAFNAVQLEVAEGIVAGAEAARTPVVLQLSENAVRFHGALAPIGEAFLALARSSSAPVVVHLDHATEESLVDEAIALGFASVMYDGAHHEYADNAARTAAVVRRGHAAGVWVEAELGRIGGKEGAHTPGVRTDPAEAAQFAGETGVDALAVAVGSEHAMRERTASLDLGLIARIAASTGLPLVLHGSSGVADAAIVDAIAAGMRKINIGTHVGRVFTDAVRGALADESLIDPRRFITPGRAAVAAEVERMLRTLTPA